MASSFWVYNAWFLVSDTLLAWILTMTIPTITVSTFTFLAVWDLQVFLCLFALGWWARSNNIHVLTNRHLTPPSRHEFKLLALFQVSIEITRLLQHILVNCLMRCLIKRRLWRERSFRGIDWTDYEGDFNFTFRTLQFRHMWKIII